MEDRVTFSVVSAGEPMDGFRAEQVAASLATALEIPPQRAERLASGKRVLRNNLTRPEAETLVRRLECAGLRTFIRREESQACDALELLPAGFDAGITEPPSPPEDDTLTCPKCGHQQPSAEQCAGCGVYFHKLDASATAQALQSLPSMRARTAPSSVVVEDDEEALPVRALVAAAAAALVGALIWQFVAVTFDYELAIIAWAIGGAVGFAAASFGSAGQKAGVACAVLALVSILGGKYLAMNSIQAQISDAILAAETFQDGEGLRPIYEEELVDAELLIDIGDELALREFMVERGYSEAFDPSEVSADEIAAFNEFARPRLMGIAASPPSYEQWAADTVEELGNVSTTELVKESLGLIDLLFLFFGVATAFRIARGSSAA